MSEILKIKQLHLPKQLFKLSIKVQECSRLEQPKCVVYTSIVGDSDVLLDPDVIEDDVEYICFTDNIKIKSSVWKIIHVDFQYRDPRRLAKIFKVLPHIIFKVKNTVYGLMEMLKSFLP